MIYVGSLTSPSGCHGRALALIIWFSQLDPSFGSVISVYWAIYVSSASPLLPLDDGGYITLIDVSMVVAYLVTVGTMALAIYSRRLVCFAFITGSVLRTKLFIILPADQSSYQVRDLSSPSPNHDRS